MTVSDTHSGVQAARRASVPPGHVRVFLIAVAVIVVAAVEGVAVVVAHRAGYASGSSAYQRSIEHAVAAAGPSVVQVKSGHGLGSGVVFDDRGDIVTNHHVVGSRSSFLVTPMSGRSLHATLVGVDPRDDIAVIRVRGASGRSLRPASFTDSSNIAIGATVIAIGNPLGLRSSVTDGIISGVRPMVSEVGHMMVMQAIQTSAAINPGNSGGALVDANGHVLGIPTLEGAGLGIGFAIPSNTIMAVVPQVIRFGRVLDRPR